ncbi:type I restriction enzyme HsdR N-terminal domain-containing protein [Echinicola sp. CAU 1574]|uniref:Type I restriction enzyme HsdR N-terminal domain-containing protein n=1 Tax=Echinicola arenosa TaxID=2774144 RepID=A0ABR9ANK9_9BACT|nr:type I restriction enzyme HsdR N-terminal domain-containing protein [Echinicola arenosa]MBD8490373.1 type I restriction enzyme HsdR N-terminal domain-containing protein [Echinicola arenosa]
MTAADFPFLEAPLNLPTTDFKITTENGKLSIFDALRKKFLVLTPEEWVRQHLIYYLVEYKKYPKSLFALERGLRYNRLSKRFDILVLDREGSPFLLVECKAPEVKLDQKVVEQVCVYNKTINARFMAISNGVQHVCLEYVEHTKSYRQIQTFPQF